MPQITDTLHVRVGPQGRVVIPASLRRQLNLQTGEEMIARVEDDRLILERRDAIERRVRSRFAHVPKGVSLADDLIAERREDAQREADG